MESKSLLMYLSYHLGSEFMVEARRMFLEKKYPPGVRIAGTTMQISGSKAEGLDMKGSDTDIMVLIGNAYENNGENVAEYLSYRYDSLMPDIHPGYVLVELVVKGRVAYPCPSSTLKNTIFTVLPYFKFLLTMFLHGPSISISPCGDDVDIVPYLKCESWPVIAREWICRKRCFGWPSQEMINEIVKQGCYIVPVGSKVDNGSENEWRLSFSLAEKYLIFTFNHTQLMIYGMLKIILKEIISQQEEVSELLCSYFLKTTLFWVIEETQRSIWDPKYMMLCFHLCLERLMQFIIEDNCPNYFLPINNMFNGRFSLPDKEKLFQIVCEVSESGLNWTRKSPTMCSLKGYLSDPYKLLDLKTSQKRKDQMETAALILTLQVYSKFIIDNIFSLKQEYYKPYLKSLLRLPVVRTSCLAHLCHYIDTNNTKMDNKTLYALRKLYMKFICLGCRADLASGKLILASWLYNQGKFKECLQVSDIVLKCLSLRVIHCGGRISTECSNHVTMNCPNFIKNLNYFSTINIHFTIKSNLSLNEFFILFRFISSYTQAYARNNLLGFLIFPDSYCYFLRYLCHLRLGNIQRSNDEFSEIERVKFIGSEHEKMVHNVTMLNMKLIKHFKMNQTAAEWESQTVSLTNLTDKMSLNDLSGIDISNLSSVLENFELFGMDPNVIRNMFGVDPKDVKTMLSNVYQGLI